MSQHLVVIPLLNPAHMRKLPHACCQAGLIYALPLITIAAASAFGWMLAYLIPAVATFDLSPTSGPPVSFFCCVNRHRYGGAGLMARSADKYRSILSHDGIRGAIVIADWITGICGNDPHLIMIALVLLFTIIGDFIEPVLTIIIPQRLNYSRRCFCAGQRRPGLTHWIAFDLGRFSKTYSAFGW